MDPKCKQMITKRQITQNTGNHTQINWFIVRGVLSLHLPAPAVRLQAEPGVEESMSSRHPKVLPVHPEQSQQGQRAGGSGHRLPQTQIRRSGLSAAPFSQNYKVSTVLSLNCMFSDWALVQRLSPDCEDQIRVILQESALDYRLDPQLQMHCSDEVIY